MRKKRKILDKENNSFELQKTRKSQRIKDKGITLIALVVTIIILLILAGVTLNIALSDNGLFSKTKQATEDYKEAQSEEEESIRQISTQLYSEYVGATVEGYTPKGDKATLKGTTSGLSNNKDNEGNTIEGVEVDGNQTFETEGSIQWRVWDYDGNTLRIIGDPTTATLTLKGAAGYNNGVWAMDYICRTLYSNEAKGAIATNLKRTDIQKVSTYDYTQYKHEPSGWEEVTGDVTGNVMYFGATKTYTDKNKYPVMWNDNDKDWTYEYKDGKMTVKDKECKKWEIIGKEDGLMDNEMNTGSSDTIFKESYYWHIYNKNEFINDTYYDLIFEKSRDQINSEYWLAGRYVHLYENFCDFGLQRVSAKDGVNLVSGFLLCESNRCYGNSRVCASSHSFYQSDI